MIHNRFLLILVAFILVIPSIDAQEIALSTSEKIGFSHRKVHTEIIINAPVEAVWNVLTDFEKMSEWSSTLQEIDGVFADGEAIVVQYKLKPNKDKITTFYQTLQLDEGKQFGWSGNVFLLGMRDNHQFILEALPYGRTRFIQEDEAIGGLTWLVGPIVTKTFIKLYSTFNEDLKKRVESLPK